MNVLTKLFNDCLTGADNKSYDNGRVICLLCFFVYFILAMGGLLNHQPWAPLEFAGGASAMAVGFGINIKLKKETEPK